MRSLWVDRLFRQGHRHSHGAVALPMGAITVTSSRATGKKTGVDASATPNPQRVARLCLGIGDGTVHKQ